MTIELFYGDAYCRTFEAEVTDCIPWKTGWGIELSETAFYPEGGGQPGDRGVLFVCEALKQESVNESAAAASNQIDVLDTHRKEGRIWHITGQPMEKGTRIRGEIDWEHRFSLMQNHSGEHIVSGLIHEAFGYENVGFHMGADFVTIDLSGILTMEELGRIEEKANQAVWEDRPVVIHTYAPGEAIDLPYRSKKELEGEIRIVEITGADNCACCGMHVSTTGQIGLIKLISCSRFHEGVRIEMLCGKRAFEYLNAVWQQNHRVSVALSAKEMETSQAVEKMKTALGDTKYQVSQLYQRIFSQMAARLQGHGNCAVFEDAMSGDDVRRYCDAVMHTCGGICCVFAGSDETGYMYAIGQEDGDVRAFVKEFNHSLSGKGGGRPYFAQGSVQASRGQIIQWLGDAFQVFFQTQL